MLLKKNRIRNKQKATIYFKLDFSGQISDQFTIESFLRSKVLESIIS